MATSAQLAVRDAVATLYAGLATVHENRDLALPTGVASHIQLYVVDSNPERNFVSSVAPVDWTTKLRTVIKARLADRVTAERAADALLTQCYANVMADQSLGGLVQQLDLGSIEWDQDEADATVVMVTWEITVIHRTQVNTLT